MKRHEDGMTTVMVVLLALALLAGAGLVLDGGRALADRRALATQADQAARVAADSLDRASLRDGGRPRLDENAARAAAIEYLNNSGAPSQIDIRIRGDAVTVELKSDSKPLILSAVGIGTVPISATGTARSIDDRA